MHVIKLWRKVGAAVNTMCKDQCRLTARPFSVSCSCETSRKKSGSKQEEKKKTSKDGQGKLREEVHRQTGAQISGRETSEESEHHKTQAGPLIQNMPHGDLLVSGVQTTKVPISKMDSIKQHDDYSRLSCQKAELTSSSGSLPHLLGYASTPCSPERSHHVHSHSKHRSLPLKSELHLLVLQRCLLQCKYPNRDPFCFGTVGSWTQTRMKRKQKRFRSASLKPLRWCCHRQQKFQSEAYQTLPACRNAWRKKGKTRKRPRTRHAMQCETRSLRVTSKQFGQNFSMISIWCESYNKQKKTSLNPRNTMVKRNLGRLHGTSCDLFGLLHL